MCLSLRLRCLLLLNGGRQGDCVRVEFWLVEALLQREPSFTWVPPQAVLWKIDAIASSTCPLGVAEY